VWNPRFTINSWNSNVETSKIIFCSSELFPVPVVKFTKNRDRFSRRCPFLVNEISIRLQVQTVLLIRTTNVEETAFSIFKSLEPLSGFLESLFNILFIMLEHIVIFIDLQMLVIRIGNGNIDGQVLLLDELWFWNIIPWLFTG